MRAKDLMIGDWVYDIILQGYTKVEVLTLSGIKGTIHDNVWHEKTFEPIPLTPEILEKNGFEKLDFSHFQIGDRRLVLDADGRWDGPLSWHWVVTEMDTNAKGQPVVLDYYVATINYVHELQHCLKLVGIDKEIQI